MKKISNLLLMFLLVAFVLPVNGKENNLVIVPVPNKYEILDGQFSLAKNITISTDTDEFEGVISVFTEQVKKYTETKCQEKRKKALIKLIKSAQTGSEEAYRLKITPDEITVEAEAASGAFYGLQSVVQLLINAQQENLNYIPCCVIEDAPRYSWRGFMLDESRHFFGTEEVKKIMDMMALQKLNKFHWHLTDEPAWRIEIKKYPLLTEVGGAGTKWNPNAPVKFYTQDEVKEIIAYAAERFIEVIPEIDMPGHATAAVRAYPEFGGGGSERNPDFTFHPGKEGTYQFLTDILKEVAGLFPSQFIHIGGDEVHFGNQQWSTFPEVKELMKNEGLKDLVDVEHYFLNRMADSIRYMGKTVMGWDEVTNAGLKKENTWVMWWRHDKPQTLQQALDNGYETILCPRRPLYFDFIQHDSHKDGRRWGGFCPIEDVYAFPNEAMTGGKFYNNSLVKGIQANVWTETMHTAERLEFMTFPRLSALAEAAWTNDTNKNLDEFKNRLKWLLKFYEGQGISFFDPLNPAGTKEIEGVSKTKN
uniref:beta-N-acetylhexosaminidase n=1 Tax=uncultured Draconibacterium sp. TaxID=1573823 RepID=UPI00321749EA